MGSNAQASKAVPHTTSLKSELLYRASEPALPRKSFTINELVTVAGFNRNLIYTLIAEGKLRTFKVGRRRFVSTSALDECIRKLECTTTSA